MLVATRGPRPPYVMTSLGIGFDHLELLRLGLVSHEVLLDQKVQRLQRLSEWACLLCGSSSW